MIIEKGPRTDRSIELTWRFVAYSHENHIRHSKWRLKLARKMDTAVFACSISQVVILDVTWSNCYSSGTYNVCSRTRHLNCYNSRFCWRIYFVYIHLRLFCVRLVRCVLDATGMLPSMDDVYVHCGPSPSTIWGMSIMSQSFCQLPTSHSVVLFLLNVCRKIEFYDYLSCEITYT